MSSSPSFSRLPLAIEPADFDALVAGKSQKERLIILAEKVDIFMGFHAHLLEEEQRLTVLNHCDLIQFLLNGQERWMMFHGEPKRRVARSVEQEDEPEEQVALVKNPKKSKKLQFHRQPSKNMYRHDKKPLFHRC